MFSCGRAKTFVRGGSFPLDTVTSTPAEWGENMYAPDESITPSTERMALPSSAPRVRGSCPRQVHKGGHVPLPLHETGLRGEQEGPGVDAAAHRQLLGDDQQGRPRRSDRPQQLGLLRLASARPGRARLDLARPV